MGKPNAAPSELIDVRRFIIIRTVSADFADAVIICENEDDVGFGCSRREESWAKFQASERSTD
jgi:hypothetical protein